MASKTGNKIATIVALGLLVVAAVATAEYAYAVVPESSDGGTLLSLESAAASDTNAVDNTTGVKSASMHTIISVVLIMSLAMVGLVILGWDKKKKA